jgi:NADPH:quinone reductase-like Zn-dependent oxidoreductase
MRAAYITELGPAEVIRYGELPLPAVGPAQVLVRVEAVALDPVDAFVRSGAYVTPIRFPFVIGRDLVGAVAATGTGVRGFAAGERVWSNSLGHGGRQGSFAEYALVSVERLYRLPPDVDPIQAVAVFHPAATAYLGLFRHGRLRPKETVFVAGGGGNVGTAVTQLASAAGAQVIASSREEDFDWCHAAGASVVVDYHDDDLADRIREAAPKGVDIYWDTSGHQDLTMAIELLAHRGRIVLMSGLRARSELPVGALYTRDASVVGFAISNARTRDLAAAAALINQRLAEGVLRVRIGKMLPLREARRAHMLIEGRVPGTSVRGRIVLQPEYADGEAQPDEQ